MALRLRVVSEHARILGAEGTKVFGVHGGSIGRASDNDWILPDPERYVSGHHASVEYRDGGYWLTDTSSNGTYRNEDTAPVSDNGPLALKDGDRLRMGDYELVVTIDAVNDFPPEKSAIVAYDGLGTSAARQSTEDDIGASLNLDALLAPETSGSRAKPVNAYGQAVELPRISSAGTPASRASSKPKVAAPKAQEEVPWNLSTRRRIEPNRTPPKRREAETTAPAAEEPHSNGADTMSGLQALCRGAGIDPASLPAPIQSQVLPLAGQILRELVMGLMEIMQVRAELKNRFRITQETVQATDNNPLRFSAGVEEALRKLFEQQGNRYLGPVEAVRESLREIRMHEQAVVGAMEEAFGDFLQRLDPSELQERFDRGGKRGLLGTNKLKYWDLYGELYHTLKQNPKDDFPHTFVEQFARAYEGKMAELANRRARTAPVEDRNEDRTEVPRKRVSRKE
ncbi:MAG TPA: type VI secretion system-associated FHA domain protein TagH [Steroidobacteraceae bacterium]|nr:type VI secretion system-associated FHA domain protein TagH [Steroidobacteraceae bacterium]